MRLGRELLPMATALCMCGCSSESLTFPGAGLRVGCTGASPSFSRDVTPIFHGCAGIECHRSGFAYSSLVSAPSQRDGCPTARVLVWPGSLEQSYLMNKLTGIGMCPGTARMPFAGVLPAIEVQTIADWICAGAQND
jgi:hypothetical protein